MSISTEFESQREIGPTDLVIQSSIVPGAVIHLQATTDKIIEKLDLDPFQKKSAIFFQIEMDASDFEYQDKKFALMPKLIALTSSSSKGFIPGPIGKLINTPPNDENPKAKIKMEIPADIESLTALEKIIKDHIEKDPNIELFAFSQVTLKNLNSDQINKAQKELQANEIRNFQVGQSHQQRKLADLASPRNCIRSSAFTIGMN